MSKRNHSRRISQVSVSGLKQLILVVFGISALFPIYYIFITAFKSEGEYTFNKLLPPVHPTLENFFRAFKGKNFQVWILNSLGLTVVSVCLVLLLASLAAFAFSRMKFRGCDFIFNSIVSLIVVSPMIMVIPLFFTMTKLGLVNNYASAILVYVGTLLPFSIFMLASFFRSIPDSIIDAALIDGCSTFQLYRRIVLPLSVPALVTLAIFNCIWVWNDLLIALIFLQKESMKTLMVGLTVFKSKFHVHVPTIMAGMLVATIPMILIYVFGQRALIRGLVAGAMKE